MRKRWQSLSITDSSLQRAWPVRLSCKYHSDSDGCPVFCVSTLSVMNEREVALDVHGEGCQPPRLPVGMRQFLRQKGTVFAYQLRTSSACLQLLRADQRV